LPYEAIAGNLSHYHLVFQSAIIDVEKLVCHAQQIQKNVDVTQSNNKTAKQSKLE
jgi:hypothetical protein